MKIKDAKFKIGDHFLHKDVEWIFKGPGDAPANFLATVSDQPGQIYGFMGDEDVYLGQLEMVHLLTLRAAVKLEKQGIHRSKRPSARTVAVHELSLSIKAGYDEIIAALSNRIEEGRPPEKEPVH